MAVTYITRIYATIDKSVDYIIRDKVVLTGDEMQDVLKMEALESANSYIENALDYIGRDKTLTDEDKKLEIRKTLTSTLNCSYDNSKAEFEFIREKYKFKTDIGKGVGQKEILGYHVWQSFEENIDQKLSNEIGMKLANELFGDFQCVVSTHNNTEHTHNHIVFNAVSWKTGKKYNICTDNTRKIREVSDRLCEEYGLSVLQTTKNMNLKWYKDGKGEWKCFEQTERNREKRKGEFSKTTDYRNYETYEKSEEYKESNCKTIRRDIDKFIPLSSTLDELIQNLRGVGYEVKDLKANGEKLKYISFKAPSQEKFTRGNANTLGADYTRESLGRRIAECVKSKDDKVFVASSDNSEPKNNQYRKPVYKYGEVDIDGLDEDKKIMFSKQHEKWVYVPRNDVEKYIIVDTKILNRNLDEIYKRASAPNSFEKKTYKGKGARAQYHIDRINENLRALNFIEDKNLKSFEQINTTVRSLYEKRNEVDVEFAKIRDFLKEMNKDIVLVKQYNSLKNSIDENKHNADYTNFEMQGEVALLKQYEEILKAKKLLTPLEQADRISKFDKFNARFADLGKAYESINNMIADYDRTVYVINRIDRDSDRRYSSDIKFYYDERRKNKSSNDRNI